MVTVGNVKKTTKKPSRPEYVPLHYRKNFIYSLFLRKLKNKNDTNEENLFISVTNDLNQKILSHLKWMLQKDNLNQDIFLIGRPGRSRRQLAMMYSELTRREIEFVSLSRDTTEADLKQRREIIAGTAQYLNQVRYIIHCKILSSLCHDVLARVFTVLFSFRVQFELQWKEEF